MNDEKGVRVNLILILNLIPNQKEKRNQILNLDYKLSVT